MSLIWAALLLLAADPLQPVFERAAVALAAGDYAAAEQGFERVLQSAPRHIGALGNLGVVYSRTNRPAKAIEVYQRALRLAPKDKGLTLNLGLAYLKLDDHARALPLFRELAPSSAQARELLATCQIYTGEVDEAVGTLESLPRSAGVLYLLAVGYARQKKPERAQAALEELFTTAATPVQANFLLGRACYDGERFSEAAEYFRKALEADPGFRSARVELGKALISLRSSEEAEKELRQALTQSPGDAEAHHYLGGLLVLSGRAEEALPHLEKARVLRPDSWSTLYYLGRAKLERNQPLEAVSLLERAAALNPAEASIYYQLAKGLKAAGRANDARRALERFSELKAGQLKDEMEALGASRR